MSLFATSSLISKRALRFFVSHITSLFFKSPYISAAGEQCRQKIDPIRKHAFFLILFLLPPQVFADPVSSADEQRIKQVVTLMVQKAMYQHEVPGMAVALYYRGTPYFYNFGEANTTTHRLITQETIFEIGSVTKLFTADLAANEIVQGRMSLNAPVSAYIPALNHTPNAPITQVTIRTLATHTASLPRMPHELPGVKAGYAISNQNLFQGLEMWQPDYPIGSRYLYSNLSFGLLGDAVSAETGQPYEQRLQQVIFQPLGMTSSFVNTIPVGVEAHYAQGYTQTNQPTQRYPFTTWPGGGAIRSTPSDMMKFLEANLNNVSDLPPSLHKALSFAQKPLFTVRPNFVLGMAWQRIHIGNTLCLTKNGVVNGFNTFIMLVPQDQTGIVVFANKKVGGTEITGRRILIALLQLKPSNALNIEEEAFDATQKN